MSGTVVVGVDGSGTAKKAAERARNRRIKGVGRVLGSIANSVAHNARCDVYIANTYGTD